MVRHTYTYIRPNSSTPWWQDWGTQTNNTEVITLYNYQNNFFNNIVNTGAGEKWSIVQVDDLTIVFTLEVSQERLSEIESLFANDSNLISLRLLNDQYNELNNIEKHIDNIEI